MENFSNESQYIVFIPKNKYRWFYQIDEGKKHIISKDNLDKYVKEILDADPEAESLKLAFYADISMRHQPFLISVKSLDLIELHKNNDTASFFRDRIKQELENPDFSSFLLSKSELPNSSLLFKASNHTYDSFIGKP